MQLSARILTALAVLAFTVAVVAGRGATEEVSAATGTIDALNVGACTTTNADDFSLDNCTQKDAFYQQEALGDVIEVDSLYATYAHDPKTGAESPRAIIMDGDLIRISITDSDRDRRDPVLITSADISFGALETDRDGYNGPLPTRIFTDIAADTVADPVVEALDARKIVADAVGVEPDDLPGLEQYVKFGGGAASDNSDYIGSGTYEVLWSRDDDDADTATPPPDFKPIASAEDGGVVKFFGRVDDGIDGTELGDKIQGFGPFGDIGEFVSLDEDVISGEEGTPPVMTLNISVPDAAATDEGVQLQVIYYETSGIEYIQGGDKCFDDPDDTKDVDTTDVNEMQRASQQAACTSGEIGEDNDESDNDSFVLHAESDEDAGTADDLGAQKQLALVETGRFTGVFQGYLRLTDADGNGEGENWGLLKTSAEYRHADATEDLFNEAGNPANPSVAVLGVGDGPVTITYKDTSGTNRTYEIQIDIEPPTIQVDSPAHNGRSDDEKPSFIGSFNDSDSGLAADSFQLNVDNSDDSEDVSIMSVDSGVDGPTVNEVENSQVRRRLDYIGYDATTATMFGVIGIDSDIYKVEDTDTPKGYKSLQADDFADGSPDGEFNGEIEVDFDEFPPVSEDTGFEFNNAVDFQAVVRDLAGNVGFSDSDTAKPRFIDALGEEKQTDRDKGPGIHNVLGVFSRHVVHIDDVDPSIQMDQSVTGFYGKDNDDNLVRDRSSVMVVFDNPINGALIDTGTFTLEHDEDTAIGINDVVVDGKLVFLKIDEELKSDARPTLSVTEGREIEDLAGNILSWQEQDAEAFEVQDGILPVITLTLSGGSGTGVGSEGPSKLTNAAMDIAIASDEDINGAPQVAVVCSNIDVGDDDELGDYVANRTGYLETTSGEGKWLCGGSLSPNDVGRGSASLSRPGNNWIYAWRNPSAKASKLGDGQLVVVVWGRDRSTYEGYNGDLCQNDNKTTTVDCENWGSQTTKLVLDTTFNSPLNKDGSGGSVQPAADDEVKEPRPFVYLDFAGEGTTVTVSEFSLDGEDQLSSLSTVGDNRYLYWPEALDFGTHKVEFDARDAADNGPSGKTSFEFDVTARDPFVIGLSAGWNAISFPANPIDTALDAVFTDEAIDRVVGWNPLSSTGPWSIASRVDGVWTTSANFAPLTDVVVRYGYWVHSMAFIKQSVDLEGPINRETGENPHPVGIQTIPGWNFVGVVDQDGDQTEDDFGDTLQDSELVDVLADDYMPGFKRAYTWDAIANGYRVLGDDGDVVIGKGIWVFFPDSTTVAP